MTQGQSYFDPVDPVLFIADGASAPLLDTGKFPYMVNDNGRGRQSEAACGRLVELAPDAPELERGATYRDIAHWRRQVTSPGYAPYEITEFDFRTPEVRYEALPATPENAQAFGATLLRNGECIRFPYDGLVMSDYTYGKWAGHESPYLGGGRSRELLAWNATDLEYHDFAHIFFSQGPLPLATTTVLGDDQVMSAPLTRPHYHEEKQPTWHGMLRWP